MLIRFFFNVVLWKQHEYMIAGPILCKAIWFVYFYFHCLRKALRLVYLMLHSIKIVIWCFNMLYREFPERISRENFLMLYHWKDYKNVTRDKKFRQSRFFVCFSDFGSSLLKYKKLFRTAATRFHFLKYKKFLRVSVSWNIRKFCFLKYKEFFCGFGFPK